MSGTPGRVRRLNSSEADEIGPLPWLGLVPAHSRRALGKSLIVVLHTRLADGGALHQNNLLESCHLQATGLGACLKRLFGTGGDAAEPWTVSEIHACDALMPSAHIQRADATG